MCYRKIFTIILLAQGLLTTLTFAQTSALFTAEFNSVTLGRPWKYKIYLPAGYDASNLHYPVLYLLHGDNGDEDTWVEDFDIQNTLDSLISTAAIPVAIAIMPASGTSWWVDGIESFETAFINDLIPAVDAEYRTLDERDGRGLVGFHSGGYGALRYALIYPGVFRTATLLTPEVYEDLPPANSSARASGAFDDRGFDQDIWYAQNYPESIRTYQMQPLIVPMYITAGDDDPKNPSGYEFNSEQQTVILFGHLNKVAGSPAELRIVQGGWEDIKLDALKAGLKFMFQFLKRPAP